MKKYSWILALLLALTMAFVFVGCKTNSSDDDDDDDDGGNVTPGEYTISFDLDGGTIDGEATFAPIKVKAGSSVGAAKWPTDPDRGKDTFEGWFEGATEYKDSTAITKNVTVKAKWTAYVPLPWPDPLLSEEDILDLHWLGEFTYENPPNQLGWFFGADGDDYAFTDDTWLLIETKAANGANMNGFGGLQLTFIDSDQSTGKSEKNVNAGWTGVPKAADEILYWAIKLSAHEGYEDFKTAVADAGFNIYLGFYPFAELGFQNAYLTEKNLDKVVTAGNKKLELSNGGVSYGNIISAKDDGIDWEELESTAFYDVTALTYSGEKAGFTTVPITLGGSIEPGNASVKTITWSTTTAGASISGSKLTSTTAGKVTVKATITNGKTGGTADFTETFTDVITVLELPDLGTDTEFVGNGGIEFNMGGTPDLDYDLFKNATYLIFAFSGSCANEGDGSGPNKAGFGGLQVAVQGDQGTGWDLATSAGWTLFSNDGSELVYVVFDPTVLNDFNDYVADDGLDNAKFVLNSGFNNYLGAWITSEDLSTEVGSFTAHGTGFYITKTLSIEK